MLSDHKEQHAVASIHLNPISVPIDRKTRERLAARRKMAARKAIENHYERRELEMYSQEYWFDG